jgi:hypothetical protein
MFSRSVSENFIRINGTSRLVKVTILSDATTWSVTYACHSDISVGVITTVIFYNVGHWSSMRDLGATSSGLTQSTFIIYFYYINYFSFNCLLINY